MYYTFIQDRESHKWQRGTDPEWYTGEKLVGGRHKKTRVQRNWVYPVPEEVSAFVAKSEIIEANTEEEAECLLRQKYPKDF